MNALILSQGPSTGQLILGVLTLPLVILAFIFFYSYLFAGISKLTGRRLTYRGDTVATPDTFDLMNKSVKDGTVSMLDKLNKATENVFEIARKKEISKVVNDSAMDKITKLKELAALKEKGLLTSEEFDIIKSEIVKATT